MNARFYKIKALTNLHAGSGDTNYGVIDNLVQRDVVTELPTIHGSSLKGALREHFQTTWGNGDPKLGHVFGANEQAGKYRFLSAHLLAMPVRSNKKAYFMATSPKAIKGLLGFMRELGDARANTLFTDIKDLKPNDKSPVVFTETSGLRVDDFESFTRGNGQLSQETKDCLHLSDDNLVVFSDAGFKQICSNSGLPVIARNKLGENKNLWYEQVVPRYSIFWTSVLHPDNAQYITEFEGGFSGIIHIGANASVGYGFTKISNLT